MASHFSPQRSSLRLLVVDDELHIRALLILCLETDGHTVVAVATVDDALIEVARHSFDLIFLGLRIGTQNGLDFMPQLLRENPWTRIIITASNASAETEIQAMQSGASDLLPKPFEVKQIINITRRVIERRQLEKKLQALQAAVDDRDTQADLNAVAPAMLNVLDLARRVAQSQANLVISGEIGSGKACLARAIHHWSDRADQPLSIVTCRPDDGDAFESELFGPTGKIEFCDGGTLILEDVSQLPMRLQPRILQLIKDHQFERLNEITCRAINLRIIATTRVDLQRAVDDGFFRADLLLALNVVQIEIPALRNRHEDIPPLAQRYAALFSRQNHKTVSEFTPAAMHVLSQHRWPGNVRELRNLIERAVLLCGGQSIGVEHLPPNLLNSTSSVSIGDLVPLAVVEELHVRRVVASARSLRQAATILGIDAATVVRRMKRYGASDDQPAA